MSMDVDSMIREAALLAHRGRVAEAILCYRRLLAERTDLSDCWYDCALLQRKAGEFSDALASYQQALDHGADRPEEVHLNRGVIYSDDLRQYAAAQRELERALDLNPNYVPALLNMANLHEDLGDREAAAECYRRILAQNPDDGQVLARHANLRRYTTPADPLIEELRRAISAPATGAADRASLGFALGRALDDCGSYRDAFAAYAAANRASRDSAPPQAARYDRAAVERDVDAMIDAFPAARLPAGATRPAVSPIFVCGMFRSGSTLIEQLLAQHPRVTAGGELELMPALARRLLAPHSGRIAALSPQQLRAAADQYLDRLSVLFPQADCVTDKRPDNFWNIGLIKTLFPHARIVHTVRDPLDNCLSIFFLHLDHGMSYALDLMDTGHYYLQYRRLMAHWRTVYGADLFDLSYDAYVRKPQETGRRLYEFLGLDWRDRFLEPGTAAPIKTASHWQVREPLHQASSGRARHYADELGELRAYLAAPAERGTATNPRGDAHVGP